MRHTAGISKISFLTTDSHMKTWEARTQDRLEDYAGCSVVSSLCGRMDRNGVALGGMARRKEVVQQCPSTAHAIAEAREAIALIFASDRKDVWT